LREGDFGISVDEGLLVDPPDALQGADIKRVLGAAIAGALALELAMRLLVGLGLLERDDLGFGQQDAILRHLGLERFQAQFHRRQIVALPRSPLPPARSTARGALALPTPAPGPRPAARSPAPLPPPRSRSACGSSKSASCG